MQGSILDVAAEAIVNAANSLGVMGGGIAGVIKRTAGTEVENEARAQAPIPVGQAIVTSAGTLRCAAIIHAPTMEQPGMRIQPDHVAKATWAALTLADARGFRCIAIPGLGTGIGGVSHADAAEAMVAEISSFHPHALARIVLVDLETDMVAAWRRALARRAPRSSREASDAP